MVSVMPRITELGVTDDFMNGPPQKTVGDVCIIGKHYRHPDSAQVAYATTVEQPLGSLPEGKDYNIAIVGGGPAGIVALYEISRLARNLKSGKINVTLYEPDLNHFTKVGPQNTIQLYGKRAGRVFAARSQARGNDLSVYEIGAMRFPEIAGLTWHYARIVYGKEAYVKPFPNPGSVPTEFLFGDRIDRYVRDEWLDKDSSTRKIVKIITDGLIGTNKEDYDISVYRIGCKDPAKISEELKSEATSPKRLQEIQEYWKEFINNYDGITLESAVRRIIKENVKCLPPIEGITEDSEKINYCVELFGCFGFGTGGFKSVFKMCLIEMMRLILWSYSTEYTLPVQENVEFIGKIYIESIHNFDGKGQLKVKQARVCDVSHAIDGEALVFSYPVNDTGIVGNAPEQDSFDFVILAVPSKQLSAITSRCGSNLNPDETTFGDYPWQTSPIKAYPPLILSKTQEAPNTKIATAIRQLHMATASKIFATIPKKIYEDLAPDFILRDGRVAKITAVLSDSGLGSTYIVPSPLRSDYYSLLISYAWEDDTQRLQHQFRTYPLNIDSSNEISTPLINVKSEGDNHRQMVNAIINHTIRDVKDLTDENKYKLWWFGNVLAEGDSEEVLTDWLSFDWTTDYTAGAFRLDMPGDHYNSDLCFRYHTHALNSTLNNRFFLANCSYSHLAGWLEGAFMSAVNAVTGLIVAANGGGQTGLDALNEEARAIMLSLEPIAPTDKEQPLESGENGSMCRIF